MSGKKKSASVLLFLFLATVKCTCGENEIKIHSDIQQISNQEIMHTGCPVDISENLEVVKCYLPPNTSESEQPPQKFFPIGSTCVVTCPENRKSPSTLTFRYCGTQGLWNGPRLDCVVVEVGAMEEKYPSVGESKAPRKKRFIVLLIVGIICIFLCGRRRHVYRDRTPPQISCPHIAPEIYAPKGQRGTVVYWGNPKVSDNKCSTKSIWTKMLSTRDPGSFFDGNLKGISYEVIYAAKDCNNNQNSCRVKFTVKVHECERLGAPANVYKRCNFKDYEVPVHGDTCNFTCSHGHVLNGTSARACQKNETWTGSDVTCQPIQCTPPVVPPSVEKDTCSYFGTQCSYKCKEGLKRVQGGIYMIKCQANGVWSARISECKDGTGPEFTTCPKSLTKYADKEKNSTVVSWELPKAIDATDGPVKVIQSEGLPPGATFTAGVHEIVYTAQDLGGNEAVPCVFTVAVTRLRCPLIKASNRLNISCPDGIGYGATCTLQCERGYPLVGISKVTCELESTTSSPSVSWDWKMQPQSYCNVTQCAKLDPPVNGALSCNSWIHGTHCQIQCQAKYDIPRGYSISDLYVCDDTKGAWIPNDDVPDCSETRLVESSRLPSEVYYYFDGDCSDSSAQEQIKQNFINAFLSSAYSTACTAVTKQCKAENVNVVCGIMKERTKRSLFATQDSSWDRRSKRSTPTHEASVTFDLVLQGIELPTNGSADVTQFLDMIDSTFDDMVQIIKQEMSEGLFDLSVPGFIDIDPESLKTEHSLLVCPPGREPHYDSLSCAACPVGTYFEEKTDQCLDCPRGTYQDEEDKWECKSCPDEKATLHLGTKSIEGCKDKCSEGTFSATGLNIAGGPCQPCPLDTYQENKQQTDCLPCPENTYTRDEGTGHSFKCLALASCTPNPCNNHTCVIQKGVVQCICKEGYSGNTCSQPPNYCINNDCQNEATCVNETRGYSCKCKENFKGFFCEQQIIDGGWSAWSSWSECSASCEGGIRTRDRECNEPVPDLDGQPCRGNFTEQQNCNQQPCPECTELPLEFGNEANCTNDGNTTVCIITCRVGTVFRDQSNPSYYCGPDTLYRWSHALIDPNATLPACEYIDAPKKANITTRLHFPDVNCRAKDKTVVEAFDQTTKPLKAKTACLGTGKCQSKSSVASCTERQRRDAESGITVINTISVDLSFISFPTEEDFDEFELEESLKEYVTLLTNVAEYAVSINESVQEGTMMIEVEGETAFADPLSLTFDGKLGCDSGQEQIDIVCVPCAAGTYEQDGECIACPVGQYQNSKGQTNCINCPPGTSTNFTGADHLEDCEDDSLAMPNPEKPAGFKLYPEGVAVILFVLGLIVIVVVIATYFACRKRHKTACPDEKLKKSGMNEKETELSKWEKA